MIYQVLEWPQILINTFGKGEAVDLYRKAIKEGRRPILIAIDSNDITLVAMATLNSKWRCLEADSNKYDSRRDSHSLYGYSNGGNKYKILARYTDNHPDSPIGSHTSFRHRYSRTLK